MAVSCPKDISQQVPHPQLQYSGPISIILSKSMASGFSSCPIQNLVFMVTLAFWGFKAVHLWLPTTERRTSDQDWELNRSICRNRNIYKAVSSSISLKGLWPFQPWSSDQVLCTVLFFCSTDQKQTNYTLTLMSLLHQWFLFHIFLPFNEKF